MFLLDICINKPFELKKKKKSQVFSVRLGGCHPPHWGGFVALCPPPIWGWGLLL